jgi:hypothetical protein
VQRGERVKIAEAVGARKKRVVGAVAISTLGVARVVIIKTVVIVGIARVGVVVVIVAVKAVNAVGAVGVVKAVGVTEWE